MGKEILGIEIGHSAIKLMEINIKRNKKEVKKYSIFPIPTQSVQDGIIYDSEKIYAAIVQELKKKKYKAKKAVYIVQSSLIFNRQIVMDFYSSKTIKQLLEIRVEDFIPVKGEDYEVDFSVLGNVEEEGKLRRKVLIVAISQKVIQPAMKLMRRLKLTPIAITVPSECLISLLKINGENEENVLMIDLGEEMTTITIICCGEQYSVHTIQYGTGSFEKIGTFTSEEKFVNEVCPQLEYFIIAEIEKNLGRFYREYEQESIHKVYLIGEGARNKQLRAYMEDALNHSIETAEDLCQRDGIGNKIAEEDKCLMMNLLGTILNA